MAQKIKVFKSCKPKRYSKRPEYQKGGWAFHHPKMSDGIRIDEVCANCKKSRGFHRGGECIPGKEN